MKQLLFVISLALIAITATAGGNGVLLKHVKVELHDQAALQRGARTFMNYCLGCHSLQYMRYNRMAQDIGIVTAKGEVNEALLRENLIFNQHHKVGDVISNTMPSDKAAQWFGVAPPDLSLIARVRGANWLYTYLMSFYQDKSKAWGVNNLVFASVSMPDVLLTLRGKQVPVYRTETVGEGDNAHSQQVVDHLQWVSPGTVSPAEFEQTVRDLVSFLVYVGEPIKTLRYKIGLGVMVFLVVLFLLMLQLKKAYWQDIKK